MPLLTGLQRAYAQILNRPHQVDSPLMQQSLQGAVSVTKDHPFFKATIPEFLYKPPFGYPLNKNVVEIRRMGRTPYVCGIVETTTSQIGGLPWKITGRKGKELPEAIVEKTEEFFYNPNSNDDSLSDILHMYVTDLLELNIGVIEKAYSRRGEFKEIFPRDAGTFTKNPDIHGILPQENSYYQYGWHTGVQPIPFDRHEIVYTLARPRTNTIYGLGAIEVLGDVLQLLTYGIDSNLEYFSDNNVPKGVMKMINANQKDIDAFTIMWNENMRKRDSAGKWRRAYHKMPIMNTDGAFERIGFNNIELEMIEQQKWFTKLVLGCFNMTPTEMGFIEDVNRASAVVDSAIFKRKNIKPLLTRIEYSFTTGIVAALPWIQGTRWENIAQFEFDKTDLQEELAKRDVWEKDINMGISTPNEIRTKEKDEPPHKDGDFLRGSPANAGAFGVQNTQQVNEQEKGKKNEEDKQKKEDKPEVEVKATGFQSPITVTEDELLNSDKLSKKFNSNIDEQNKEIIKTLKAQAKVALITGAGTAVTLDFTKKITGLINMDIIKAAMTEVVRVGFLEGQEIVGRKIGINILPNQKAINFLENYNFDNVQALELETRDALRAELQRGLINRESTQKLADRVEKVMKSSKVRAKAIAQTEVNRAQNFGELFAWRQSGMKVKKEWTNSNPQSDVCKFLTGTRIGIDEKFFFRGNTFDAPPAHVNCKSTLKFFDVQGVEL